MNDPLDERLGVLRARVHDHLDRSTGTGGGGDIDDVYHRRDRHNQRRRVGVLVTVMVLVLVGVVALTTVGTGTLRSEHLDIGGPAPAPTSPASTTAEPSAPVTPVPPRAAGYQLLFPFASAAQALDFQAAWKVGDQGGPDPGGEPGPIALSFAAHLGFDEIDQVIATTLQGPGVRGRDAQVTIGFSNPNGEPARVAVIHLVRLGLADDAPWEVVGTEDTLGLTLETPAYGSTVASPVTVGGRITGVDESISIKAFHLASDEPIGESPGVPAGGDNSPWASTIRIQPPDTAGVLTVVAVTGGHLSRVERFAVTGIHLSR